MGEGYMGMLYLCNSSINLKIFQNKKFKIEFRILNMAFCHSFIVFYCQSFQIVTKLSIMSLYVPITQLQQLSTFSPFYF